MGMLIDGQWQADPNVSTTEKGHFKRAESQFRNVISDEGEFTPDANRYHIFIANACPWANRAAIMRKLKGLEDCISLSTVDAVIEKDGWSFAKDSAATTDPLYNFQNLHQIYCKADPNYTGRVTVPILWDKHQETIVNNESAEIIRILNASFGDLCQNHVDYYPNKLRNEIDEINDYVYTTVNNGVYKCGFAKSQEAYDSAFVALFNALDKLDDRLANQRYLVGHTLTEADIRLFTTLIRFDAVYFGHFKCNKKRIADYANLGGYCRDLYQTPGFGDTIVMPDIKNHYYRSHILINPSRIVPLGPEMDFAAPHQRDKVTQ